MKSSSPSSTVSLPDISQLKDQAKRLRAQLGDTGKPVTHSESLELIAHQMGFRDWNTLFAAVGNNPQKKAYRLGARITGHYLGQAFAGEIIAAQTVAKSATRLTINFDEAVDVVKFKSFSAFRKRVSAVVNKDGVTPAKTSDGKPQLVIGSVEC